MSSTPSRWMASSPSNVDPAIWMAPSPSNVYPTRWRPSSPSNGGPDIGSIVVIMIGVIFLIGIISLLVRCTGTFSVIISLLVRCISFLVRRIISLLVRCISLLVRCISFLVRCIISLLVRCISLLVRCIQAGKFSLVDTPDETYSGPSAIIPDSQIKMATVDQPYTGPSAVIPDSQIKMATVDKPYTGPSAVIPDSQIKMATVEEFINEIAKEKPIRFSPERLARFTKNYAIVLGSGGFGTVYKGELPNGMLVAAKVLNRNLDKRVEEQFMAEVGTMGRTYHINLVRLYGFCFDPTVTALVYEYMENGSLDKHLFSKKHKIEWKQLLEIAIGTAKGIRYLHEECRHRIVHYDIKPENILLDANFSPKVADFGLAKLCNRDITHMSMAGGRGTPGYAAPEMWMPCHVTYKSDVYSFGMLLFEIVGRRRNFSVNMTESQEWFPKWVWTNFENGRLQDIASCCGIEEVDRESAERMCKVALWCVQYQPKERPPMGKVVKMLEGDMEITPPINPFHHLLASNKPSEEWNENGATYLSTTEETSETIKKHHTPIMRKYEIEIATSA